jgi:hypothetical protein
VDAVRVDPSAAPAVHEASGLRLQARVRHAQWDARRVTALSDGNVTVFFDNVGYRTLSLDLVAQRGLLEVEDEAMAEDFPGSGASRAPRSPTRRRVSRRTSRSSDRGGPSAAPRDKRDGVLWPPADWQAGPREVTCGLRATAAR